VKGGRGLRCGDGRHQAQAPTDPDLSFLYGVILTDDVDPASREPSRISACSARPDRPLADGIGVTARMALDVLSGRIPLRRSGASSATATAFWARRSSGSTIAAATAVRVRVEGRSFHTGSARFVVEAADPLGSGSSCTIGDA